MFRLIGVALVNYNSSKKFSLIMCVNALNKVVPIEE